ncbi:hypothetical protein HDV01_002521 [Terramyces sp. JEL0728]|nr:hypothetical protein HDV01_002521 [Terramyces sp. JEL0728]
MITIFFSLLLAFAQSLSTLNSVPVLRDGFHALEKVHSSYESKTKNGKIVATVKINPTFPTINLANFPDISIDCLDSELKLSFKDAAAADKAFDAWNKYPEFVLIVNHEYCQDDTRAYKVNEMHLNSNEISVDYNDAAVHEVIEDYEVNIAHVSKKRSGVQIPININYDNRVLNPEIEIYSGNETDLSCSNCYLTGSIDFEIKVQGSRLQLKDYQYIVNGDLFASIDLEAKILSGNRFLYEMELFRETLDPISVGGLFTLGPTLVVDTAISYAVAEPIDITGGFEANLDFGLNLVVHQKPKFTIQPEIKPHEIKLSKDIQASLSVHLMPRLEIGMQLFKNFTIGTRLPVDTSISLQYDQGSFASCKNQVDLVGLTDVSVSTDLQFGVQPSHESFDLYNSGQVVLDTFCQ